MKHSSFASPMNYTVLAMITLIQIQLVVLFHSFLLELPLPVLSQINTGAVIFNCLVAFHLIRALVKVPTLVKMPTQLPMDTLSALITNSLVLTQAQVVIMHPVQFHSPA
jgi:hypothetical protein